MIFHVQWKRWKWFQHISKKNLIQNEGVVKVEQKIEGYTFLGTDLLNLDFAAYAKIRGGVGIKVSESGEHKKAVKRGINLNKPVIIDVDTDSKRF